jgi:hypothetical protein
MRYFGLIGLVAALNFAPSIARADTVFDVSATVGNIQGGGPAGPSTGLTLTGTLDIDTVGGTFDGGSLTLQGDANIFTSFSGCPANCTFFNNSGFAEFGLADLIGGADTLVGYAGGALLSDSYIDVLPNSVAYDLTGTVTPEGSSQAPEPGSYGVVALGLGALYAATRRRV